MGFGEQGVELWQDSGEGEAEPSYPEAPPRNNSQHAFRDAIRGLAPTPTPGEYGRRALALCLAIQESSDTSSVVHVKHFDGDDSL